jgi:hypothetical protein
MAENLWLQGHLNYIFLKTNLKHFKFYFSNIEKVVSRSLKVHEKFQNTFQKICYNILQRLRYIGDVGVSTLVKDKVMLF